MKIKTILPRLILLQTLILTSGCQHARQENTVDLQFIVEEGYKYADRYKFIENGKNQMKIYNFLLDVKTREQKLRDEVGDDYADAFITAFNDSAHVINNY